MMADISPQGYDYPYDDSTNPFWKKSSDSGDDTITTITASASVSDTTGTPAVSVTKTVKNDTTNFDFAFSGLKGNTGATGSQGPAGSDGISPAVTSTGSTESGAIAGTVTGSNGNVINIYNGAQGETGPAGSDADISKCVTNISVENTNGVYDIKQTVNGTESDVGQINVPNTDNLLAEVTDSVIENETNGYDFHTIKETENNGAQNEVGKFYIARTQITELNSDGSYTTVDQSGNEGSGQIAVSTTPTINIIPEPPSGTTMQWMFPKLWNVPFYYNGTLYFPQRIMSGTSAGTITFSSAEQLTTATLDITNLQVLITGLTFADGTQLTSENSICYWQNGGTTSITPYYNNLGNENFSGSWSGDVEDDVARIEAQVTMIRLFASFTFGTEAGSDGNYTNTVEFFPYFFAPAGCTAITVSITYGTVTTS